MNKYIRNIGIMAHIDAGKTTITERILFYTGKVHKMGDVHNGNTVMDWMKQEQERGITITSAATSCSWKYKLNKKEYKINIIDTPGHVDFTVEVERSLRVLDGAIAVFDGVSGVEAQTEVVWMQANKYKIPRICFINKMDKLGSDIHKCLEMIKKRLKSSAVLLQLPIKIENNFLGVIDLIEEKAFIWKDKNLNYDISNINDNMVKNVSDHRYKLIESVVENDYKVLENYITSNKISNIEIKKCLRIGVLKNFIVPIYCGSAFKNKGIQLLIDGIVEYLPSPNDINDKIPSYKNKSLCMLAFKVMNDSFVGSLTFVRIYRGEIKKGMFVQNTSKNKKEKIGRILVMHANNRNDIEKASSGDIVAITGFKDTSTGNTITQIGDNFILEKISFPEPVIEIAIEPKLSQDFSKMSSAISKLLKEDPSLRAKINKENNQTILAGMGELHLEIIIDRIKNEFLVDVNTGEPQVSYRETITKPYTIDYLHKKQSGGAGQFARIKMSLQPIKDIKYKFENKIFGGNIPKEYIPGIEKGIKYARKSGTLLGYPVVGFKIVLLDGDYHDVDSSILSFEIATKIAFCEGVKNASPVLLEPIMNVSIDTPKQFVGSITGYLSSLRGKILSINCKDTSHVLKSKVPLSSMFGFVNSLRAMTQGRALYNMSFADYNKVPSCIFKKINKDKK